LELCTPYSIFRTEPVYYPKVSNCICCNLTTRLTASDEKCKVHGQSGESSGKLWNGCDHTGVPELRAGEPRKGKRKSGKKVGKVAKEKERKKTHGKKTLHELAVHKLQ
jgi:hypothetical protein